MKYKTPTEAGIAALPVAPKRKPYKQHARKAPTQRYVLRLKKGQSVEQYLAEKTRDGRGAS